MTSGKANQVGTTGRPKTKKRKTSESRFSDRRHLCIVFIRVIVFNTAVSLLAALTTPLEAQSTTKRNAPPATVIEGRVDAIFSKRPTAQAGIGLSMFGGTYVRTGIVAAIGANDLGVTGRTDGFVRFHLDPFRQSRRAPYGGAGLSGRFDAGSRPRAYVLVFAGIDGPVRNGMTTSFEVGLGGGARIGVVLRQAVAERR